VNPERVREVQQLWVVALNYLKYADGLKDEGRTYEDLVTGAPCRPPQGAQWL
jgi:hypothetical protein